MTNRTPFTPEDLYQLDWLEDPRVSPDGRLVVSVRVTVDRVRNHYRRSLWLAPVGGDRPRRTLDWFDRYCQAIGDRQ